MGWLNGSVKLIGYPAPWHNKVRTFCQNPGGFVAQENYDNDLAVVNGHSFKEKKSNNTNLAILVSHNFTEPFNLSLIHILYAAMELRTLDRMANAAVNATLTASASSRASPMAPKAALAAAEAMRSSVRSSMAA